MAKSKRTASKRKVTRAVLPVSLPVQLHREWRIDARALACEHSPSWAPLAETIKQGGDCPPDLCDLIYSTWRDFFNSISEVAHCAPADVLSAVHYWQHWPRLFWLHQSRAGARLAALDLMRDKAEKIIMFAAETAKLDSSSIAISGRACCELIYDHPELGEWGDWPECLFDMVDKVEPADIVAVIRQSERVIMRLTTTLRAVAAPTLRSPECQSTHSEDFTSMTWNGIHYQFAKGQQAESVKLLWREWERGKHSLSEKTIGEEIGSGSDHFRLLQVFRNRKQGGFHPAWEKLIVRAGKGIYKLAEVERITE